MRVIERLTQAAAYFSALMLMLLSTTIFVAVIMRYVFNRPLPFADEISSYLCVNIIFLGFAYTMKEKANIRVEFLTSRLRPKSARKLEMVVILVGFIWVIPLAIGTWKLWYRNYSEAVLSWGGLQLPLWVPSLMVFGGSVLLLFQLLVEFLKLKKEKS